MSGEEVLRRLRANASTADIPVMAVSADATPSRVEEMLAAGASTYVSKPLDVERFLESVDGFLSAG